MSNVYGVVKPASPSEKARLDAEAARKRQERQAKARAEAAAREKAALAAQSRGIRLAGVLLAALGR